VWAIMAPKNTREAFEVLVEVSKYMQTISYEELAIEIGKKTKNTPPANLSLNYPLGHIRDELCRRHGIPWLNALAVGKHSHVPGESFLPEGSKLEPKESLLWWRGMVLQVHAYPWETVPQEWKSFLGD